MDVGTVIGGYRVEAVIGRGGMGVVYRATQVALERVVALKVIAPEFGRHADFQTRFRREARLAASLNHPNIVAIYEAGEADGQLYLSMQYVEGSSLRELIARASPLSPRRVGQIIGQVASALGAAHQRGVVHRDVKPANILLTPEDHAFLTDFGLATRSRVQEALTASEQFVGTIQFMSPEQITGEPVDGRSDQYALGVVLFNALTGQLPFQGENDVALLFAHVNDRSPAVTALRPDLDPAFDEIVGRALAKSPEDRYPTVLDLARALGAAVAGALPARPAPVLAPEHGAVESAAGGIDADASDLHTDVAPDLQSVPRSEPPLRSPGGPPPLPPSSTPLASPGERIPLRPGFSYIHHPLSVDDAVIPLLGNEPAIRALAERIDHSHGGSFLVTGFRGVGKSTVVLRAVAQVRANSAEPIIQVHLNVARPRTPDELLFELIRRLFEVVDDERLLGTLSLEVHRRLLTAYERTTLSVTHTEQSTRERSSGLSVAAGHPLMGVSPKAELSSKTTDGTSMQAAFLNYTAGDVEQDFMRIMRLVRRPGSNRTSDRRRWWRSPRLPAMTQPFRGKIVVILDELDKLTDRDGPTYIEDLLRTLKNLFTAGDVHFIFVAGPDLHEAALRDSSRGNSVYDSVFAWELYVPCVWDAPETFLRAVVANPEEESYEIEAFANYLRYKARGVPRLLLKELNDFVTWDGDCACVELRGPDLARVMFYAEMERVVADFTRPGGIRRTFGVPIDGDRWHLGAYYLADAILRTGGAPFTAANLVEQDDGLGIDDVSVDSQRKVEALCEHFVTQGVLEINSGRDATSTYYEDSPETHTVTYRLTGEIVAKLAAFARVDERERAELRPEDVRGQPWAETGAPPRIVGVHYELLAELDSTGIGYVYSARDRRNGQLVAVKMLTASEAISTPEMEQRFRRNASIAAELVHPNIVRTLDVFLHNGAPALVMELVEGTPLRNLIDQVPIPPPDAVNIALGLLDALSYLHRNGVVRCDLKPSGIMVNRSLKPVVLDLGIAKRGVRDSAAVTALTRTGVVIGTPAYLAPEQVTGGVIDQRSDLFTVAALTVEMLTGRPPRGEGGLFDILNRAAREDIDVDHLEVSTELREALRAALARDPDQRYTTAADMRAALVATPEAPTTDASTASGLEPTVIRGARGSP